MGGQNPFIRKVETRAATTRFHITFQPMDETVEVDPERVPYGRDGQPGSILDIALGHDIDLDHACGGVCACSTCHVLVRQGLETCGDASDDALDPLAMAPGLVVGSRLGCLWVPDGTRDLVIEIPNWNRNLVSESH
jgi:2Fe-2S ferredoxin